MLYTLKRKGKRLSLKVKLFAFLLLIAALCGIITTYYHTTIKPIITSLATSEVETVMMKAINNAAIKVLAEKALDYESVVTIEKDLSGKIVSLTSNSVVMNLLKSQFINEVVENVDAYTSNSVYIPIGNIIAPSLFSGHGPKIRFDLMPESSVTADYINSFVTAGINQTRHQILIKVKVSAGIYLPGYTAETEVETKIIVAETIIVGAVPNDFTYFDSEEDESDELIINNK